MSMDGGSVMSGLVIQLIVCDEGRGSSRLLRVGGAGRGEGWEDRFFSHKQPASARR